RRIRGLRPLGAVRVRSISDSPFFCRLRGVLSQNIMCLVYCPTERPTRATECTGSSLIFGFAQRQTLREFFSANGFEVDMVRNFPALGRGRFFCCFLGSCRFCFSSGCFGRGWSFI